MSESHISKIVRVCRENDIPISGVATCGAPGCTCAVPRIGPFSSQEDAFRAAEVLTSNGIQLAVHAEAKNSSESKESAK